MLNRTSSQICGRWYLPMFLLRGGSLTQIYRASLMVLVLSPHYVKIFNTNFVTGGVIMVTYGGWGPLDVPWTSLQMFWRIPLYIPHHTPPCHICTYRWLHSFSWEDLCPWEPSGGFWWYYLFWSILALHIFGMFSWAFHSALCNMAYIYNKTGWEVYIYILFIVYMYLFYI